MIRFWTLGLGVLLLMAVVGCNPAATNSETRPTGGEKGDLIASASPNPSAGLNTSASLEVLVISSAGLGEVIQRVWDAESEDSLTLRSISLAEFVGQDYRTPATTDVIVYPGALQADLISREQLLEIPSETWNGSEIGKAELLNYYRTNLVRYGNKYFAAPLGGQQLCLMYRADVLAAIGQEPPHSWADLVALAEIIQAADSIKDSAGLELPTSTILPLAQDWPAHLLLAIAAPSIRSSGKLSTLVNADDLRPLIDRAPFQESLQVLLTLCKVSPNRSLDWTPRDVYREMASGRAALAIGWPSKHFFNEISPVAGQIKIAALPGSQRFFDFANDKWVDRQPDDAVDIPYLGIEQRVVSAARNSLHANRALDFVAWLSSKRISSQLADQSEWIGPFRNSQLADPQKWTGEAVSFDVAEQFAAVIRHAHESKLAFIFPRVTQQSQMIEQLANGIREAIQESALPETVLRKVAAQWEMSLRQPGEKMQRELLRRGEGL